MKILIIISLIIIHCKSQFLDYDSTHALNCTSIIQDIPYQQNVQTLWSIVILHVIDRYLFLVITPFLIVIEIIFILVFLKYKKTLFRRQGTIFFAIIIISTTINIYYFIHSLYVTIMPYNEPMPASFPNFCMVCGIVYELADCSLNLYLMYFVFYTLLNIRQSIRDKQVINKKILHFSVAIISIGWVLFLFLDQRITVSQFGLCGSSNLRYNTIQWFLPILQILENLAFLLFAIYTYFYFRSHMPVNQTLIKRVYHENQAISFFVIVQSVLITLFDVSLGVVYFNCFKNPPLTSLLPFATIMNISKLFNTIFLLYFIMTDQTIKKKTKRFIRLIFQKMPDKDSSQSFMLDIKDIDFSQDHTNDLDLDITLKERILELKEEQHQIDLYKISQIATMIAGVCVAHQEYFNTKTFSPNIRKIHFQEKIVFSLEPKTLKDYGIETNKIPKADILKGTITMIAPRIFSKLLHSDNLINVQKSFDLSKNYHKMYNIAQGKGGKSGQFFFFSYDNKYVLKTINKLQYSLLVESIQQFFQYYQKNPQTLLSKIYGIYTIKGQYIGQQYHLILMKNIFGCKKDQIIRTYDIKGSKHDRQVIKQKENQTYNELQKLTLKDTDFIKLQAKLYVKKQKIRALRYVLEKDTNFLKNFNLIDYSLLIIRVKWNQKPQNQKFWNSSQRIQSSRDPQQYYHIGLIDYMQAWNMSKKSQNCFKSLIGKKQISAQQPNFYQHRFMQFFEQITYWPDQARSDLGQQNSNFEQQLYQQSQKDYNTKKKIRVKTKISIDLQTQINSRINQQIISPKNIRNSIKNSKQYASKSKLKEMQLQIQKLKKQGRLRKTSFQTEQGYNINYNLYENDKNGGMNLNQSIQEYKKYLQHPLQIPKQLSDIQSIHSSKMNKNIALTSFQGQLFFRKNNLMLQKQRSSVNTQSQQPLSQYHQHISSPQSPQSPHSQSPLYKRNPIINDKRDSTIKDHNKIIIPAKYPRQKFILNSLNQSAQISNIQRNQDSKADSSLLGSSFQGHIVRKDGLVTFNNLKYGQNQIKKHRTNKILESDYLDYQNKEVIKFKAHKKQNRNQKQGQLQQD